MALAGQLGVLAHSIRLGPCRRQRDVGVAHGACDLLLDVLRRQQRDRFAAVAVVFERALGAPRSLAVDETLNRPARPVNVQGVEGRFVISDDAGQAVELYALEGGLHADDMLIAYLPGTKAIVEADLRWPGISTADLSGRATIEVVSRGKHLLHRVEGGITLHSHLRMEGQWRVEATPSLAARWRRNPQLRALVSAPDWTASA